MKLKTKIQLFSSLFMLLLILLVNTSIYFLFYKISAENELSRLSNETNTIVETLQANPDVPRSQLLKAFVPENGIIRVIDQNGEELIPTITKSESYTQLAYEFIDHEKRTIEKDEQGHYIAVVMKPIIWENGEVATLQVANFLIALDEMMHTLFYVLVAASLIILIPTVIAGNLLSKFVIQPIQKLIETMKINIHDKNWQLIEVENESKDELYEMVTTFNELMRQLKESFKKQEQFVSDASHELKTPLSIIKSYAELLKRRGKANPELITESIDVIEQEAERMQLLVNQLLDLAKNKQAFPHEPIDLVPLVKKVHRIFADAYDRKIHLDIAEKSVLIKGNEKQIEQVVYILLSNAIKYSEKEIALYLYVKQQFAVLDVIDKGIGIPEEEQKRIFDRFYRIDKARSRQTGGTGLGLAIANEIVKHHGGTIEVVSEIGKGSTFTVNIPMLTNP
ncbi:MAG: sensor histidine kinase [Bacilli bacterium]|nr:sensor histidine kinase [Bacilli bacterium]